MRMFLKSLAKKTGIYPYLYYLRIKHFPPPNIRRELGIVQERKSFYNQFLKSRDLCFDVGANIGNRVFVFKELGARVIAVEPQKDCVKILELRFGNNSVLND